MVVSDHKSPTTYASQLWKFSRQNLRISWRRSDFCKQIKTLFLVTFQNFRVSFCSTKVADVSFPKRWDLYYLPRVAAPSVAICFPEQLRARALRYLAAASCYRAA